MSDTIGGNMSVTGDDEKPWRYTRGTKIPLDIPEPQPRQVTQLDLDRDRRKVERAMRKRQRQLGGENPTKPEITEYDMTLFGRPVRIEIDVCIGIDDLKKLLNGVRADITNAILALEQTGRPPSDRRHSAHLQLCRARAKAYILKQELKLRGKSESYLGSQ